ncbi:hypothetical protein QC762_703070 [Podospora pseudocomata]|uniref:DUF6594 domain-containing protein n=1 Tax=Podospora pseudocomata TaxID=2093779 RepID=A0ABR0G2V4_9PEZI|nr:hypothetical protein QC762_703070 [Podospora pseudocomata]
MMDSPLYPPTLSEMEEPDWLDLAANASAENQCPVDSCNAPSSLAPPPPPPVASLITTVKPASHSSTSIQEKPWKHEGYQAYCKLLASESDLFIARRFKSLNVRVALRMQDEVSRLEEQLLYVEKESREHKDVDNGTFRQDMVAERSQLLDQISTSLYRYNKFIIQQTALLNYPTVPLWDIKNLKTWHKNHDNQAISQEEMAYLDHTEDLIPLAPRDKTPLRRAMDKFLFLRTLPFWRDKSRNNTRDIEMGRSKDGTSSADQPADGSETAVNFYSDKTMDHFVSIVTVTSGLVMLVVPIWVLHGLVDASKKLGVITAFVLACLLFTSFAMTPRPLEALGATAAYAAVLMVFLQVGS